MTSPITITTTPIMVAKRENRRYVIRFQNTGNKNIYITKQLISGTINIPSPSNYDYLLTPNTGEGADNAVLEVQSTARFDAVSDNPNSTLAISKTFIL